MNFNKLKVVGKVIVIVPFLLLSMFNVSANNRYTNAEGQGKWIYDQSAPAIEVFIKGSSVYAKIYAQSKSNASVDLPAIQLKKVNSPLLNEYTEEFIKIQDFNQDKLMDIGILKSVGYGGGERCYSVFEYQPNFYSFNSRATKTICVK